VDAPPIYNRAGHRCRSNNAINIAERGRTAIDGNGSLRRHLSGRRLTPGFPNHHCLEIPGSLQERIRQNQAIGFALDVSHARNPWGPADSVPIRQVQLPFPAHFPCIAGNGQLGAAIDGPHANAMSSCAASSIEEKLAHSGEPDHGELFGWRTICKGRWGFPGRACVDIPPLVTWWLLARSADRRPILAIRMPSPAAASGIHWPVNAAPRHAESLWLVGLVPGRPGALSTGRTSLKPPTERCQAPFL